MKIVHVLNRLGSGGSEVVALNLALEQVKKHNVTVITIKSKHPKGGVIAESQLKSMQDNGVNYIDLGFDNLKISLLFMVTKLVSIFRSMKPDIVHSHSDHPDLCVSLANYFTSIKKARTIHSTEIWPVSFFTGYVSEFGFKNDLVVAVGSDTLKAYKDLRKRFHLSSSKYISSIPNGVRYPVLLESSEKIKKKMGFCDRKLNVGYVGRLHHQKGVDILFKALNNILLNSVIELHIIGDGEEMANLKQYTESNNLNAKFHGSLPNAGSLMCLFDVMVVPSRVEGFGLVSIESQLSKTPVIISKITGLRETVTEDWPLIFDSEDIESLSKVIKGVVDNKYDLASLSEKGYQWAKQFTVENMAARYNQAYLHYLNKKLL